MAFTAIRGRAQVRGSNGAARLGDEFASRQTSHTYGFKFLKFFRTSVYGRDETGQDARMEEGTSSFLRQQKYSMLKNVQGRTFLSGVLKAEP